MSNATLVEGFRLFFINRHVDAINFFEAHEDIPVFAMGKCAVMVVWSLMTIDDDDLQNSLTYVKQVQAMIRTYVSKHAPARGWFSYASSPFLTCIGFMSAVVCFC
jgi:hypothetical protein